ncbi:MAG: glycosyltransferase [Phycisphaerales bacterium]
MTDRSAPMRLAYLTNQYPAVSHTFIRRELRELERRGHLVVRCAIRPSAGTLVDPEDLAEASKTFHVVHEPRGRVLLVCASELITRPARAINALRLAIGCGRRSPAGVLKNLIYLAEAVVLRRRFARDRIEHVHVHFGTNPAMVARLVRTLGGPGYSITVHGPDELDDHRGHDLAGKIADARFTVAISDFTRSQLMRWADRPDWDRLHVVHCTVGDEDLSSPPVEPPSGAATFVNVGRLSAQKGQLVLIDGFARLIERGVDARLVIVGDGELRPSVEQAIRENELESRITLTGSLPGAEVRKRLAEAHALVLPSFAEGLPMVIMEAFAVGTPVISTTVAGIPELVEHGRSGILIAPGRADLVADAMERIAQTPADARREMARVGRAAVVERHRTRTEGDALEGLIRDAIDRDAR